MYKDKIILYILKNNNNFFNKINKVNLTLKNYY